MFRHETTCLFFATGRTCVGVFLALGLFLVPAAAAIPAKVKELTGFPGLGESQLQPGMVQANNLNMARGRDMGVESLFFIPSSPKAVMERLADWSPTRHKSLGVYVHQGFTPPPKAAVFNQLAKPPQNSAVKLLERETVRSLQRFNLSQAEQSLARTMFSKGSSAQQVRRFWIQLLSERATTYFGQGVRALPPYKGRGGEVKVREEALALIRSQPKLFGHFKGILADAIFAPKGNLNQRPYWELLSIQGTGTLNLGCLYWRAGDGGWQAVDFQFYFSSGLYTSVITYQIWPATLNGQSGALVWRSDLISSPFFNSSGVNRVGTNMMMQQELKKTIGLLKSDLAR